MLVKIYQKQGNKIVHLKDLGIPFADGNLDTVSITDGNVPVDGSSLVKLYISKNTTITFTGTPLNGFIGLLIYNPKNKQITWPNNITWALDEPPEISKTTLLTFGTNDGGQTWIEIGAIWPLTLTTVDYEALAEETYYWYKSFLSGYTVGYKNSKTDEIIIEPSISLKGVTGDKGETGEKGISGGKGENGEYPFLAISNNTTLEHGETGGFTKDNNNSSIQFYSVSLPKGLTGDAGLDGDDGEPGDKGEDGDIPELEIGSITIGNTPSVSFSQSDDFTYTMDMVVQKGAKGDSGNKSNLKIGTVSLSTNPGANITNEKINLSIPKGSKGNTGDYPNLSLTHTPNTNNEVTVSRNNTNYQISLPTYTEEKEEISTWRTRLFLKPNTTTLSDGSYEYTNSSLDFEPPVHGLLNVCGYGITKIECIETKEIKFGRNGSDLYNGTHYRVNLLCSSGLHYSFLSRQRSDRSIETEYTLPLFNYTGQSRRYIPGAYFNLTTPETQYRKFDYIYFINDITEISTSTDSLNFKNFFIYNIISDIGKENVKVLDYRSGYSFQDNLSMIESAIGNNISSNSLIIANKCGAFFASHLLKNHNCYGYFIHPVGDIYSFLNSVYIDTNPQAYNGIADSDGLVTQEVVNSYENQDVRSNLTKNKIGSIFSLTESSFPYYSHYNYWKSYVSYTDFCSGLSWYNLTLSLQRIFLNQWCLLNNIPLNNLAKRGSITI